MGRAGAGVNDGLASRGLCGAVRKARPEEGIISHSYSDRKGSLALKMVVVTRTSAATKRGRRRRRMTMAGRIASGWQRRATRKKFKPKG